MAVATDATHGHLVARQIDLISRAQLTNAEASSHTKTATCASEGCRVSLYRYRDGGSTCIDIRTCLASALSGSAADRIERQEPRHETLATPRDQSAAADSASRGRRLMETRHGEQPESPPARVSSRRSGGYRLVRHDGFSRPGPSWGGLRLISEYHQAA
jgi:hypothetical protein